MLPAVMPGRAEVCPLVRARGHALHPARIRTAASIAPSDLIPQPATEARCGVASKRQIAVGLNQREFPMSGEIGGGLTRRSLLLTGSAAGLGVFAGCLGVPGVSRANDRPRITHGLQSGDVSVHSGVVWARVDRPARVFFDIATTDSFNDIAKSVFIDALPDSDFAVKALIDGLPAGQ